MSPATLHASGASRNGGRRLPPRGVHDDEFGQRPGPARPGPLPVLGGSVRSAARGLPGPDDAKIALAPFNPPGYTCSRRFGILQSGAENSA